VALAGKSKSWSKTLQTLENAMHSEPGSFGKIFIASWIEKLVANSLHLCTVILEVGAVAYFELKFHEIVSSLQIYSTTSIWSWHVTPLHAFMINSWKFLYIRLPGWLNRKHSSAFGDRLTFPPSTALQRTNQNANNFRFYEAIWGGLQTNLLEMICSR